MRHEQVLRGVPLHDRLDWAKCKVDRLDKAVRAFLHEQTVTTRSEPNAESTEYVVRVEKGIEDVPFEIGLEVGEIAHHVRSTLDWLAWKISRSPCEDTLFPIWSRESRTPQGRVEHPGIAGGLTRDAKRLIQRLQPYEARKGDPTNNILHWLKELDNIDKHRHLVAVGCSDSGYFRQLPVSIRGMVETEDLRSELKPERPIARITLSEPNPGLEFQYEPLPFISVNGIAPSFDDLNIVTELAIQVDTVRRIITDGFVWGELLRR